MRNVKKILDDYYQCNERLRISMRIIQNERKSNEFQENDPTIKFISRAYTTQHNTHKHKMKTSNEKS